MVDANVTLRFFRNLSEQNIYDLIQKSAKKSWVLDLCQPPWCPTRLIFTSCYHKASQYITNYYVLPTEWKQAIVNPLPKKGASDVIHKNLRPISNLHLVSKITERAVFDQVYSSMTDNDLFPVLQSAYRKGHSTETALLRVVNDILSNMNKQQSAALDTVDHAILLGQHETSFSITDAALA